MLRKLRLAGVVVLVGVALVGCNRGRSVEAYIPDQDVGRHAIEAALEAWKAGKPMETISRTDAPAVTPQDSDWKQNKRLSSYTIGDEIQTTEGPKQFSVQLRFAGSSKPVDTVYYVVGRDPLWVFRDIDYNHQSGM